MKCTNCQAEMENDPYRCPECGQCQRPPRGAGEYFEYLLSDEPRGVINDLMEFLREEPE